MNDYSLNESAYRAKLAVRGVGYSWGIAQDVARAIYWLAARGIDGFTVLSAALANIDSGRLGAPVELRGLWESTHSGLCPLLTGPCLSDCGELLLANQSIDLKELAFPLLVLPFVADVAAANACVVHFKSKEFEAIVKQDKLYINGEVDVAGVIAATLTATRSDIDIAKPSFTEYSQRVSRVSIAPAVWQLLGEYAHRTYAPATAASRLSGAGAGLTDSD